MLPHSKMYRLLLQKAASKPCCLTAKSTDSSFSYQLQNYVASQQNVQILFLLSASKLWCLTAKCTDSLSVVSFKTMMPHSKMYRFSFCCQLQNNVASQRNVQILSLLSASKPYCLTAKMYSFRFYLLCFETAVIVSSLGMSFLFLIR